MREQENGDNYVQFKNVGDNNYLLTFYEKIWNTKDLGIYLNYQQTIDDTSEAIKQGRWFTIELNNSMTMRLMDISVICNIKNTDIFTRCLIDFYNNPPHKYYGKERIR